MAKHYALAREAILAILTAYTGITTDDGNIGGTTLRDRNLIGKDSQKIVEKTILIMSGDADWEDKGAASFAPLTGIITLQSAVSAQIKAGTIFSILNISSIEIDVADLITTLGALDTAAATGPVSDVKKAMAYIKQLITGLALDGSAPHSYDYTKATVPGWLHGFHMVRRMLFVVPEALASGLPNTVHNVAIKAELDKLGLVETITQADALTYPDYESITLTVLGSPLDGTAWTTTNLAHIKAIFGLPVVCVDATAAAYLKMGTDGGNAATKTVLNAIANIEGSILGTGIDDNVGLAAGANTVAASGVTFSTLDMSDVDITEIWYAYESVNANTDVLLAEIRKTMPDATTGKDLDGADVPGTLAFYGCAYSMDGLNTLGKTVLHLLVEKLLHSSTAGLAVILSGEVGNLAATIGNRATPAAAGPVTNTDKLMAYVKQLVTALIALDALVGAINATTTDSLHGKLGTDTELADYSLYDLLGGNAFKTNALSAMLGAFTSAQNLKAILGNLTTTKNLGGILGALTTTDNLKGILGAYTTAANLKAAIDTIKALIDSAEAAGPYSYLDTGGEQTVKEDTAVTRRRIWVEFSNRNMTQIGTFRIYRKVNGTNYDLYVTQAATVAAGDDRAWDAEFTTNQAWKLTYEEGVDEGANRDIPYNVITQVIE